jgi:hypothetical protein
MSTIYLYTRTWWLPAYIKSTQWKSPMYFKMTPQGVLTLFWNGGVFMEHNWPEGRGLNALIIPLFAR